MGKSVLHVMQVSTQFTDNGTQFNADMSYIVAQNPDVVGLSELGQTGRKAAFQAFANSHGYKPSDFAGDAQIMVREGSGISFKGWDSEFVHDSHGRTMAKRIVMAHVDVFGVDVWAHVAHWVPEAQNGGQAAEDHRATSREMANQVVKHARGRTLSVFMGDINADPDRAHYPRALFRSADMVTVWDEKKVQPITFSQSTIDIVGRHTGREDVRISNWKVHPPQNSDHKFVSVWYEVGVAGPGGGSVSGGGSGGSGSGGGGSVKGPKPPPVPAVETDPDPRVRMGRLFVHGGKLKDSIADRVTQASLSWATDSVTQLSMQILDPGLALYREGVFAKGVALLYREPGMRDVNLRVASVTVDPGPAGTGGMQIAARSEGVWKLKRRRGPLVMKKASPSQFVAAECKAVGLKAVVQPSPARGAVARDVKKAGDGSARGALAPSSWTTFQRLAGELGYIVFEFADTVYFGTPTWLIGRDKTPLQVAVPLPGAPPAWAARQIPTIVSSEDSEVAVDISGVVIEKARFKEVRPGGAMQLRGVPPYNDMYLIGSVDLPLIGTDGVTLSASTPKDPEPQPPVKRRKGEYDDTGSSDGGGSSTSADRFVEIAISASNARYVFGAEASSGDPTPAALDCSELIEWALGRMGIKFVDGSGAQYAATVHIGVQMALGTKGALLWKEGHIGISMGDGRSVEARNPSDGVGIFRARDIAWAGGGLIRGLSYR